MKTFYDKLLLLLATLALLGGVAFYLLKSGNTPEVGSAASAQPDGAAYEAISIPDPTAKTAEWPPPEPQPAGEEWLYQVFTPPKIYIDKDGNFTAIPPEGFIPPPPFGIYLAEGPAKKPYRLQIQGFSGNRNKPEECVLFFFDEERQVRFFIRPGQTNDEAEVEVLDFDIDTQIDDENNVEVAVVATILDKRSGETIKLVDGERLFVSEMTLTFRSNQDESVLVELTVEDLKPDVSFETPQGQFTLKEINLEDKSVTVEKQATEDFEAETKILISKSKQEPETTTTRPVQDTPDAPIDFGDFDSVF